MREENFRALGDKSDTYLENRTGARGARLIEINQSVAKMVLMSLRKNELCKKFDDRQSVLQ